MISFKKHIDRYYVNKLKEHFRQVDENKKNKEKIEILDFGFNKLVEKYQKEYEKEIRKDKLEKLNN